MIETKWITLSWWSDWDAIIKLGKGFNWVNLSLIGVELEYEKHGPCFSITMKLLGFGVSFSIALPFETEQSLEIKRRIDSIGTAVCSNCGENPYGKPTNDSP